MLVKGKLLAEETFGNGEQLKEWEASGDVAINNSQLKWASKKGGPKATLKSTFQKKCQKVSWTELKESRKKWSEHT